MEIEKESEELLNRVVAALEESNKLNRDVAISQTELLRDVVNGNQETTRMLINATVGPSKKVIAPVGRSCDNIQINNGDQIHEIDSATAQMF